MSTIEPAPNVAALIHQDENPQIQVIDGRPALVRIPDLSRKRPNQPIVGKRILQFGAATFGRNASERCGRSGTYSAVHNGPSTVNVLFELNNRELLITDDAFDKIAD